MLTASLRVAAIIGADIAIVAAYGGTRQTFSVHTLLFSGTHIMIRAVAVIITLTPNNRGMETTFLRVAGVGGTPIPIITADGVTSLTHPVHTEVTGGTYTAIVTG